MRNNIYDSVRADFHSCFFRFDFVKFTIMSHFKLMKMDIRPTERMLDEAVDEIKIVI